MLLCLASRLLLSALMWSSLIAPVEAQAGSCGTCHRNLPSRRHRQQTAAVHVVLSARTQSARAIRVQLLPPRFFCHTTQAEPPRRVLTSGALRLGLPLWSQASRASFRWFQPRWTAGICLTLESCSAGCAKQSHWGGLLKAMGSRPPIAFGAQPLLGKTLGLGLLPQWV